MSIFPFFDSFFEVPAVNQLTGNSGIVGLPPRPRTQAWKIASNYPFEGLLGVICE